MCYRRWCMALGGFAGLTLGKLASFLTFNKSFNMPISQVSQQLNSIVMAQAGAKRVFDLLDEKVETDEGYVTLVRAKKADGKIVECPDRTGNVGMEACTSGGWICRLY